MNDTRFIKLLIFINSLIPFGLMAWDFWRGNMGTNPLEFVTRTTGALTLVFLLITLSVTPIRKLTGWNWLIKHRRMLGLYAFFYGTLHFLTYLFFDRGFDLVSVLGDIYKRPFIAVGALAFFMMVPLAVTSTNNMIKRLGGKRWAQLHKLTYLVAIGGVLHYYLLVKSDIFYPVVFGVVLAVLLGYRLIAKLPKAKAADPASET